MRIKIITSAIPTIIEIIGKPGIPPADSGISGSGSGSGSGVGSGSGSGSGVASTLVFVSSDCGSGNSTVSVTFCGSSGEDPMA